MAKKRKGQTKRELFKEGVYALATHVIRAIDITRQDHPLKEVQDLCHGIEALMHAAENAADLGYGLEVIAVYQPALPGMEEMFDASRTDTDSFGNPIDSDFPF